MIAVFEEVNGQYAVFLVEDLAKKYHLHLSKLPPDANPGDVFKVAINEDDEIELYRELREERNRRKESNRMKREFLKRRQFDSDKE